MTDLTDRQWKIVEPLLRDTSSNERRVGRPRTDPRAVFNGIMWIIRTGATWADLPSRYPPATTCHRWYKKWSKEGVIQQARMLLFKDLKQRGKLGGKTLFINDSFAGELTFAGETEGIDPSARRFRPAGPRRWQWSTAVAFRFPLPVTESRRPKATSSSKTSSETYQDDKAPKPKTTKIL